MEELIKTIKKNKIPCFFVSPHLDDAALSSGELIRKLAMITDVTVINVFTSVKGTTNTMTARKALKEFNFNSASDFYAARLSEDDKVLKSMNAKIINLHYVEAIWRKIKKPSMVRTNLAKFLPEFDHVYPTYKLHIAKGVVSRHDEALVSSINIRLKKLIPQNAFVFCPSGVGSHVDHLIVKKAVEKSFKPIYWLDQPYFKNMRSIDKNNFSLYFSHKVDINIKKKILSLYKSQINVLFPNGKIPHLNEAFFVGKYMQ